MNKKVKICILGMLISLAVLLIVFYATDGLTGDKGFSEYTYDDWSIAMLPLSIIIVSGISTLVFALILFIRYVWMIPALKDYNTFQKFYYVDSGTEFLVFDKNELKRACCRSESPTGLWISVKEYNLKTKSWTTLEKGRHIEDAANLTEILQKDYKYDKVKFYYGQNR